MIWPYQWGNIRHIVKMNINAWSSSLSAAVFLLLFYTRTRFPLGPDKSWIMVGSVCKDLFFWMNSLWKQYVFYRFRCVQVDVSFQLLDKKLQLMVSFWPTLQVASPYPRNEFQFLLQLQMTSAWKTKFQSPFSTLKIRCWHVGLKTDILLSKLTIFKFNGLALTWRHNVETIRCRVNVEQDLTWHLQTCLLARPGKKSNRTRGTW